MQKTMLVIYPVQTDLADWVERLSHSNSQFWQEESIQEEIQEKLDEMFDDEIDKYMEVNYPYAYKNLIGEWVVLSNPQGLFTNWEKIFDANRIEQIDYINIAGKIQKANEVNLINLLQETPNYQRGFIKFEETER